MTNFITTKFILTGDTFEKVRSLQWSFKRQTHIVKIAALFLMNRDFSENRRSNQRLIADLPQNGDEFAMFHSNRGFIVKIRQIPVILQLD